MTLLQFTSLFFPAFRPKIAQTDVNVCVRARVCTQCGESTNRKNKLVLVWISSYSTFTQKKELKLKWAHWCALRTHYRNSRIYLDAIWANYITNDECSRDAKVLLQRRVHWYRPKFKMARHDPTSFPMHIKYEIIIYLMNVMHFMCVIWI